jgi:hypothetical protein
MRLPVEGHFGELQCTPCEFVKANLPWLGDGEAAAVTSNGIAGFATNPPAESGGAGFAAPPVSTYAVRR